MKPITRIDMYLATISGDEDAVTPLPEPITRIDYYLANLAGMEVAELPEPVTRIDYYLAALCGMNVVLPDEPITRIDFYLAALNGETVDTPEAVTRIDYYLNAWAQGGGDLPWAEFSGNPLQFNAPKAHTLRSTSVAFTPIQDLHGYANPWPAGGGVNKIYFPAYSEDDYLTLSVKLTPNVDVANQTITINCIGSGQTMVFLKRNFFAGQYTISFNTTNYDKRTVVRCYDANENLLTNQDISVSGGTWNAYYNGWFLGTGTFTVPSEADHFWIGVGVANDVIGTEVVLSRIQLELGSTATAWSPYSNICPISGWTGLDIYRAGENLFDPQGIVEASGHPTYTYIADGYVRFSTGDAKTNGINWTGLKIPTPATFSITVKNFNSSGTNSINLRVIYDDGTKTSFYDKTLAEAEEYSSVTTIGNGKIIVAIENIWTVGREAGIKIDGSMINLGSTASPYEPYTGETTTLTFPSTVYGGTASVAEDGTGTGSEEWYTETITSATPFYTFDPQNGRIIYVRYTAKETANAVCNMLKSVQSISAPPPNTCCFYNGNLIIGIPTGITTADEWKSLLDETPLVVSYELATPAPFSPTVTGQPTAVAGINTMWTDGDNLTVEARAIDWDNCTWQDIVFALKKGIEIPNGVEFDVPHATHGNTDGLITFITRRCNVDKVHGDPTKPTCTIQTKYLLSENGGTSAANKQYDRPESPFPPLENAIPANTVVQFQVVIAYGQWTVGAYNFTPTVDLPVGTCLTLSGYQNTALTGLKMQAWTDQTCITKIGEFDINAGAGDATVNLGSWQNHPHRVSYGSNNEPESNVFQWLNSIGNMRQAWAPQTPFDTMTTNFGAATVGFISGFPEEFRAHLGLADIDNITNNVYECPPEETNRKITHTGYFWLASRKEIYGTNENANEADEIQFPYFKDVGTTDADKLMYAEKAASPTSYWLRTPYASYASIVQVCYTGNGGGLSNGTAHGSYGVAPLAILVP